LILESLLTNPLRRRRIAAAVPRDGHHAQVGEQQRSSGQARGERGREEEVRYFEKRLEREAESWYIFVCPDVDEKPEKPKRSRQEAGEANEKQTRSYGRYVKQKKLLPVKSDPSNLDR
jgi:hypothetical protein